MVVYAGTGVRTSGRLAEMVANDTRAREYAARHETMPVGDTVGTRWLDTLPCMFCHQSDRPDQMMLCDLCGGGCHIGCNSVPFERVPHEDDRWLCLACARGVQWNPAWSRPSPVPVQSVQDSINVALVAGWAGATQAPDNEVFEDFGLFHFNHWFWKPIERLEYFNSSVCLSHRALVVPGYLAQLATSSTARTKNPKAACAALQRQFRMSGMVCDVFGWNGAATLLVAAIDKVAVVRVHPVCVGATENMVRAAAADSRLVGSDRATMIRRMLGLASLYAYVVGARVSDVAATKTADATYDPVSRSRLFGVECNKHTLLVSMVSRAPDGMSVVIRAGSSKTTRAGASKASHRPRSMLFEDDGRQDVDDERHLVTTVARELPRWIDDAKLSPRDMVFCFRHVMGNVEYLKRLDSREFGAYVKGLAAEDGLPTANFSTKSWKKATVSHSVLSGESESQTKARGQHASSSSSAHYRPTVQSAGGGSAGLYGMPRRLAIVATQSTTSCAAEVDRRPDSESESDSEDERCV